MQNATTEFGWLDLATGDWQKIFSCPYSTQKKGDDGQSEMWSCKGMNEDTPVFPEGADR